MERNENKFLIFVGLSFIAVLISAFLLTIFGMINLRIVNEVELNFVVEYFTKFLMFMTNMFFIFSITYKIFDKRILWITIGYIPLLAVSLLLCGVINNPAYDVIFTTVFPFFYTLIMGQIKVRTRASSVITSFGLLTLLIGAYQQISGYIKISFLGFEYYNSNILVYILLSIDLYLLYILIYLGVRMNVQMVDARKLFIFSEAQGLSENEKSSIENELELHKLNNRQRFIFWCMAMSFQIFQLAVVLLIGFVNNMFIELLTMLIVFWLGRPILKKSWHSKSLTWCSITSFTGFYVLTKISLPFSVSLFSCISFSCLFVYVLYRIGVYTDDYEKLLTEKQERESFSLKTCNEAQLLERCRLAGFSKEDIELSVKLFVHKVKIKELATEMNYEEQSLRNKKYLLAKKLN